MRILYVTTISITMNSFLKPHIEMLVQDGNHVDIACNHKELALDKKYSELNCSFHQIDFSRSPFSLDNIRAYHKLKMVIKEGNYDIVHCHTPTAAAVARLACKNFRNKNGLKVIYTAHGFHFYKGAPLKNWLLYYSVERFLARWTDVLITINKEDYSRAQKFKAGKIVYVPGVGIDTEKYSHPITEEQRHLLRTEIGVPDDAILLCSVGELNGNKNHAVVIRALSQLENKNVHYCIAGEGDFRDRLTALSQELGVADRVHLLGYRTDIHELYKSSDIFCFPSLREGLPVSLMEAMASGLPCVASRIRGNVDLLDGQNAMLFDPTDAEECKEKIDRIMTENKNLCKIDYSSALRPFSQDAVLAQMKEVYGIIESPICPRV